MNLQETLTLVKALKAMGVTRFKSLEHDFEFDHEFSDKNLLNPKDIAKIIDPVSSSPPDPIHSKEAAEATAKLKEMLATANMPLDELANKMFGDEI